MPRKAKLFNFTWVDEIKRGVYRSRFTCADITKKYSKEELAEKTNTFAPTPYVLELKCLLNGWHSHSGDVRCACLFLGTDSGDSNGQPVFMRMPPEYLPHFYALLDTQDSETKALYMSVDPLKEVVLELVGNLYGRRPAGSNYRKECEEVVTHGLVSKGYQFIRGTRDPTVYTCCKIDAMLLHHVDDTCLWASDKDLEFLQSDEGLGKYLDMKNGVIETPGTKVNVLGERTQRTESNTVTCRNAESKASGVLTVGVVALTLAVPLIAGTPASSSGEAETRALSRGARNVMFIKQLAAEDFRLRLGQPRLWTDATTALQTAKRLGAGSKMRHIEFAALYVQEVVHQKLVKVGNVFGELNPANCLTKHMSTVLKERCVSDLGMADMSNSDPCTVLRDAAEIQLVAFVASLVSERTHRQRLTPWKPNLVVIVDAIQICAAHLCRQRPIA
ncbi:unnamed protein product [Symbiodinium sp. CCMP2592]|nr:unnamed protein product [Symbiodinium sp. CCMP2592]